MDTIEIVHLRAYSESQRDEAVAAFRQLTLQDTENDLLNMILLKNASIGSDLCIHLHWHGQGRRRRGSRNDKSPLGLQLASTFSEFGLIDHSVWNHECGISEKTRRIRHEKSS